MRSPDNGSALQQARWWVEHYRRLIDFEEHMVEVMHDLTRGRSAEFKAAVESTNVRLVQSAIEDFRGRLEYWQQRVRELEGSRREGCP